MYQLRTVSHCEEFTKHIARVIFVVVERLRFHEKNFRWTILGLRLYVKHTNINTTIDVTGPNKWAPARARNEKSKMKKKRKKNVVVNIYFAIFKRELIIILRLSLLMLLYSIAKFRRKFYFVFPVFRYLYIHLVDISPLRKWSNANP